MTSQFTYGSGSVAKFAEQLKAHQKTTVVIRGETSYKASGAIEIFRDLDPSSIVVAGPLPNLDEVTRVTNELELARPNTVVAVGGGLVIDTMKTAVASWESGVDPRALLNCQEPGTGDITTVAIPTTAGSGAEQTPFAVLYVLGKKASVEHPLLRPDHAIVDPDLSRTAPKHVAASSGLDAICHCIESMWAQRSTDESRDIASVAFSTLWNKLPAALEGDFEAHSQVALAASQAGQAIGISRTTASHALSYYLSAKHRVSHGHAVALTLPAVMTANSSSESGLRALRVVAGVVGAESIDQVPDSFASFVRSLGLPDKIEEAIGLRPDTDAWLREINLERLANNPASLTHDDLVAIIEASR